MDKILEPNKAVVIVNIPGEPLQVYDGVDNYIVMVDLPGEGVEGFIAGTGDFILRVSQALVVQIAKGLAECAIEGNIEEQLKAILGGR